MRSFRWDARDLMVEQTDPLGVITRHGFGLLFAACLLGYFFQPLLGACTS